MLDRLSVQETRGRSFANASRAERSRPVGPSLRRIVEGVLQRVEGHPAVDGRTRDVRKATPAEAGQKAYRRRSWALNGPIRDSSVTRTASTSGGQCASWRTRLYACQLALFLAPVGVLILEDVPSAASKPLRSAKAVSSAICRWQD